MAAQGDLRYFQQKGERVLGANTVCLLCPAFLLPKQQSQLGPMWLFFSFLSQLEEEGEGGKEADGLETKGERLPLACPVVGHLGSKEQPTPPSVEPVAGRRGHTWWAVPSVQTASKDGLWGWQPQSPAPRPQCGRDICFIQGALGRCRATAGVRRVGTKLKGAPKTLLIK